MNLQLEIKEVLHYMLLPVPSEKDSECIEAINGILEMLEVNQDSYSAFIKIKYEAWRLDNHLDPTLKRIIGAALSISMPEFGDIIERKYFQIHTSLLNNPFISFELSVILLSHLRLIVTLAREEKMSSAKITNVLWSIDSRLERISWREVQQILRILKLFPELNKHNVLALYSEDEALEEEYFADASIADAAFQVGEVAKNLQFNKNAGELLRRFSIVENAHIPYLQIIHYQCIISGFYDHVLCVPYEFNPRGAVASLIFNKWNRLLHTSNPFLNNAKAVDVLDENWARSRKKNEYEQASILVDLLKGLDGMGFAARQELASWIRRWLVRYIKIYSTPIRPISSNLDNEQINDILNSINSCPTKTYGILEQRYVDVLASIKHAKENGWRSRGLGDSVNANNISKKKLGDCDFQNSAERTICAYEAHGGILSKVYLEGHLRTLKRSLDVRIAELENIDELSEWKVKIVFVAYGFETALPLSCDLECLSIKLEYITFKQLFSGVDIAVIEAQFVPLFIDIINNRRTPSFVRDKVRLVIETRD